MSLQGYGDQVGLAMEQPFVPLDGPLERSRWSPLLTALLLMISAFILFQLIISPLTIVLLLLVQGVSPLEVIDVLGRGGGEYGLTLLAANTIGQFLGLALPAWIMARLHSSQPRAFLRARASDPRLVIVSLFGLVALIPVVQWLGPINESIPLPDFLEQLEKAQNDLIEQLLKQNVNVYLNLFMLALTPAICEELLFRGYFQRQMERSFGPAAAILISGITFGLYHLRLSQVIPLSVLGLYLAYLAWRTGSLWAPMVVHFVNNAIAVIVAAYNATHPGTGLEDIENMNVPWYIVMIGAAFFVVLLVFLDRLVETIRKEKTQHMLPIQSVERDEEPI